LATEFISFSLGLLLVSTGNEDPAFSQTLDSGPQLVVRLFTETQGGANPAYSLTLDQEHPCLSSWPKL